MNQDLVQITPTGWKLRPMYVAVVLGLYLFFAFQYWLVLYTTTGGTRNPWREALIDYFLLKATLTIPLLWLYFVKLRHLPFKYKIMLHMLTGSAWVYSWFHLYRLIQDWRGGYYIQGYGSWWDVYIPGLFYCIQFSLFHLYEFYLQVKQQKEIRFQLAESAFRAEINLLKSQIQPHFLFNTLNSISASVPAGMERTREMIAQLADTFRYCLRASKQEYVEIGQELDFIKDFLALEKIRFGERLALQYNVDETMLQALIPPMIIQPLIENSVIHGIGKSVDGGTITLNIINHNQKISIEIVDTGIGYAPANTRSNDSTGTGLANTRKRLKALFAETLSIEPNLPRGTRVSFQIPLLLHDEKY